MAETLSPACILSLNRIETKDTQARATLSDTIVEEYAQAFREGAEFPPIEVYFDDRIYWLADGFHRLQAAKRAGRNTIIATVYRGGKREALLHALGANETHGLRRTDADRRYAVTLMLNDPEWRLWNNSEVARRCKVSEFLVRTIRRELEPARERKATSESTRKVTRGGKTYTMRTDKIGATPTKKVKAVSSIKSKIDTPPTATPQEPTNQPVPAEAPADVPPEPRADTPAPAKDVEPVMALERLTPPPIPSEPQVEPATDRLAAAARQEPAAAPHAPAVAHPDTTTDQEAATPTEGLPQPPSYLAHVWDLATDEQRKVFVALRRDELQGLLSALSSPAPATPQTKKSTAPRRATPQKQRRPRVPAQNPR